MDNKHVDDRTICWYMVTGSVPSADFAACADELIAHNDFLRRFLSEDKEEGSALRSFTSKVRVADFICYSVLSVILFAMRDTPFFAKPANVLIVWVLTAFVIHFAFVLLLSIFLRDAKKRHLSETSEHDLDRELHSGNVEKTANWFTEMKLISKITGYRTAPSLIRKAVHSYVASLCVDHETDECSFRINKGIRNLRAIFILGLVFIMLPYIRVTRVGSSIFGFVSPVTATFMLIIGFVVWQQLFVLIAPSILRKTVLKLCKEASGFPGNKKEGIRVTENKK